MTDRNVEIVRASYLAYEDKDRIAIEALIAEDFHYTSPLDNRIDRKTYFQRCWPNTGNIAQFQFIRLIPSDDQVVVTYIGTNKEGGRFRNTEVARVRDGKIVEVEVYFGWSVPHAVPQGAYVHTEKKESGRRD
jgi:ketosteroid isomerase-like protein